MADRRTTIDGDQITDHTITPDEILANNSPSYGKVLSYDNDGQFYWIFSDMMYSEYPLFEEENGEIQPNIRYEIFMYDDNDDLTPTLDGIFDEEFEIILDEIVPKE